MFNRAADFHGSALLFLSATFSDGVLNGMTHPKTPKSTDRANIPAE
jgi:hypothetical protein